MLLGLLRLLASIETYSATALTSSPSVSLVLLRLLASIETYSANRYSAVICLKSSGFEVKYRSMRGSFTILEKFELIQS